MSARIGGVPEKNKTWETFKKDFINWKTFNFIFGLKFRYARDFEGGMSFELGMGWFWILFLWIIL